MSVREVSIPYVGGTVVNGTAVIVAIKQTAVDVWVVLAINYPDSPYAEYVTWLMDPAGIVYSGHYYRDLTEAVTDYTERF